MGLSNNWLDDLLEKMSHANTYECIKNECLKNDEYVKKSDVVEMIDTFKKQYAMSYLGDRPYLDLNHFDNMMIFISKGLDGIEIPSAFLEDIEKSSETLSAFKELFGDEYKLDDIEELKKIIDAKNHGAMFLFPKDGMIYMIEEANGERWISNKPIREINIRYGWGLALLQCSLFDKGKYFSREEAEKALKKMEN